MSQLSAPDMLQMGSLIACVLLYIFNEVRKEIKINKKKHKSLDKNVFIDASIYPILWELLSHYSCTRVYITQFHNGDNFYTGQSIQRMTISHEVAMKGVQKMKPTHDNIMINEMNHRILMCLQKSNTFLSTTESIPHDSELYEWMVVYSIGTLLQVRIIDTNRKGTVAVLSLHWRDVKQLTDISLYEIQELNKKFEKIFDEL